MKRAVGGCAIGSDVGVKINFLYHKNNLYF